MDYGKFQQPDNYYRPAPFWAINDRITPEETARQMADMRRVGLSGGFFHSRAGLITDYLGEDWFAAMEAALQVAREQDGYLWLYDEDLWPSGNAGGQVAGMKDEYRAAMLVATLLMPGEAPADDPDYAFKAAYLIQRDGVKLISAECISLEEARARVDAERLLITRWYAPKTGWWSGESYANLLHPEVTEHFLRLTHDVYLEKFGNEFGKRVPGIFTDEPQISYGPNHLAWYEGLPERYQEWTGRDWWADLPSLYLDGPDSRVVRLLVHRTILRQFCEAYSKPIFDWCEQHHIAHTGHYNAEDSLAGQIQNHGGGIMSHYRYQQIPGIDHLCRQAESLLLTVKQTSSAARQLGREQVLTEIFGVSRHTNTFADFKWIGDYDLVLGANFFCPHLTLYSARGRRKRDYPPNWNYQQSYWDELRPLNDYFTRVGYALTRGQAKAEVLLLHPVESGTAGHRLGMACSHALPGEDLGDARLYDTTLRAALEAILNAGIDCDLGDEVFLEDMGAVDGNRLRIGHMCYSVVVVPPSTTWRPGTYDLLQQFVLGGGKLIFLGEPPKELDCMPAVLEWAKLTACAQVVPCGRAHIQEAVERVTPRPFLLADPEGRAVPHTYVQHRVDGGQDIIFLVNSDRESTRSYVFTLLDAGQKSLACWNPLDGSRTAVETQAVEGDLRCSITLPPSGSLLLIAEQGAANGLPVALPALDLARGALQPLPDRWSHTRGEENVLVMDRLSASVDGGKTWWEPNLDFRVRERLARHFGVQDALVWQPWVAVRKGLFDGKGGEVVLRYCFCSAIIPKNAFLVMEDLTKGAVTINGTPVELSGAGWHWDRGFGKVEITPLVKTGLNTVEYRVQYDFLTEVEPAYVVGDFGVRLHDLYQGEIINEPDSLNNGSWSEQGYPFYSGRMTYRCQFAATPQEGTRSFLQLNRASGILYAARLNGADLGRILWYPHRLELTAALQAGINELEIDVIPSRQNTLGPLHEWNGDDNLWCGPNAFEHEFHIREAFSLFDYGLLAGAEIVTVADVQRPTPALAAATEATR